MVIRNDIDNRLDLSPRKVYTYNMKTKIISFTLVPLLFLLTGCMKLDGNAEINKAGQINGTFTYTLEKSDARMLDILNLNQFKAATEQGGSSCTTTQYLEDDTKYTATCKYINASPGADKRVSVEKFVDVDGKTYFTVWYRQQGVMQNGSCWDGGKKDAAGNAIVKPCTLYGANLNDSDAKSSLESQVGSVKIVLKLPGNKAFIDWDKHGDSVGIYPYTTEKRNSVVKYDSDYEYVTISGYWSDYMNLGFVRDPSALNNRELREKAAEEAKAKSDAEAQAKAVAEAEAKLKAEAEAKALADAKAIADAKAKADAEIAIKTNTIIKNNQGKPCAKLGQKKTVTQIKFLCIKSGKKLVWKKV